MIRNYYSQLRCLNINAIGRIFRDKEGNLRLQFYEFF